MRSALVALVMCSSIGACALDLDATSSTDVMAVDDEGAGASVEPVGGAVQGDSSWPTLPSGACEDRCYEIYLNDVAECQRRLQPRERPPCYDRASQKHGECRKRCRPHEPDGFGQSEPGSSEGELPSEPTESEEVARFKPGPRR